MTNQEKRVQSRADLKAAVKGINQALQAIDRAAENESVLRQDVVEALDDLTVGLNSSLDLCTSAVSTVKGQINQIYGETALDPPPIKTNFRLRGPLHGTKIYYANLTLLHSAWLDLNREAFPEVWHNPLIVEKAGWTEGPLSRLKVLTGYWGLAPFFTAVSQRGINRG